MHTTITSAIISRFRICVNVPLSDRFPIGYNEGMAKIIDTTDPNYIAYCKVHHPNGKGHYNGAYYYSCEIVKNIIPNVKTDRTWDTMGMRFLRTGDHAIVFIHHNIDHDKVYNWLRKYKDLILVCATPITYEWAKTIPGDRTVFLPLSIDVDYVKQFIAPKTKELGYMGNRWSFKKQYEDKLPANVEFPPQDLPREELLKWVAPYKKVYAIGRCAVECRILGAEVLPFYPVFPSTDFWKILSNQDAAVLLQKALDDIERGANTIDCRDYPEYNNMVQ